MAVTKEKAAPYAPGRTVLDVVLRYRAKGLPPPITGETLARISVSDSLISRTLQALVVLDLIDDKGMPTPTLEKLRLAPEAEFKERLAEWLNAAYAEVIAFVDPATATEIQIRDAFRPYKPPGQQDRMVILFSTLYAAAGVRPEKEQRSVPERNDAKRVRVAVAPRIPAAAKAKQPKSKVGGADYGNMHPLLAGLLADLPAPGSGWTQEKRDKVVKMFPTVLDFAFPIVPADGGDELDDLVG